MCNCYEYPKDRQSLPDEELCALVKAGDRGAEEILVARNLLSNEEKGGGHPPLGKPVQKRSRGGTAGPVVKGEGDELSAVSKLGIGVSCPALWQKCHGSPKKKDLLRQ